MYDKEALQREISILKNLMKSNHSNIIKVINIVEADNQKLCYIFMERCC